MLDSLLHNGLLSLSNWGYVGATLLLTHITIASVTIFLHRHQAHRSLTLHPAVSHFFRLWLWLTTGIATREWVAVHRKHHAKCETPEDPHSPQQEGIWKVLFTGMVLYRREAMNEETLALYGRGAPDDWVERVLYSRFRFLGLGVMFGIDLLLFGMAGLAVFAVQMLWIPFWAAGVINGVGHYLGYRNFETQDASRNILPIGVLIGGEELHNNHHAYQYSARLSNKWWEIDSGWIYIRLLEMLGLAEVRRNAPQPVFAADKQYVDRETLQAVICNRFHVLKLYCRQVIVPALREHAVHVQATRRDIRRLRYMMIRDRAPGDSTARQRLDEVLRPDWTLTTVYEFKLQLMALCGQSAAGDADRLTRLKAWCAAAEASGVRTLTEFANQLPRYTMRSAERRAMPAGA